MPLNTKLKLVSEEVKTNNSEYLGETSEEILISNSEMGYGLEITVESSPCESQRDCLPMLVSCESAKSVCLPNVCDEKILHQQITAELCKKQIKKNTESSFFDDIKKVSEYVPNFQQESKNKYAAVKSTDDHSKSDIHPNNCILHDKSVSKEIIDDNSHISCSKKRKILGEEYKLVQVNLEKSKKSDSNVNCKPCLNFKGSNIPGPKYLFSNNSILNMNIGNNTHISQCKKTKISDKECILHQLLSYEIKNDRNAICKSDAKNKHHKSFATEHLPSDICAGKTNTNDYSGKIRPEKCKNKYDAVHKYDGKWKHSGISNHKSDSSIFCPVRENLSNECNSGKIPDNLAVKCLSSNITRQDAGVSSNTCLHNCKKNKKNSKKYISHQVTSDNNGSKRNTNKSGGKCKKCKILSSSSHSDISKKNINSNSYIAISPKSKYALKKCDSRKTRSKNDKGNHKVSHECNVKLKNSIKSTSIRDSCIKHSEKCKIPVKFDSFQIPKKDAYNNGIIHKNNNEYRNSGISTDEQSRTISSSNSCESRPKRKKNLCVKNSSQLPKKSNCNHDTFQKHNAKYSCSAALMKGTVLADHQSEIGSSCHPRVLSHKRNKNFVEEHRPPQTSNEDEQCYSDTMLKKNAKCKKSGISMKRHLSVDNQSKITENDSPFLLNSKRSKICGNDFNSYQRSKENAKDSSNVSHSSEKCKKSGFHANKCLCCDNVCKSSTDCNAGASNYKRNKTFVKEYSSEQVMLKKDKCDFNVTYKPDIKYETSDVKKSSTSDTRIRQIAKEKSKKLRIDTVHKVHSGWKRSERAGKFAKGYLSSNIRGRSKKNANLYKNLCSPKKRKMSQNKGINSKKIHVAKELLLSNSTDNVAPLSHNRKCAVLKESLELQLPNTEENMCIDKARGGINANIVIGLGDNEQSHSSESIRKTDVESKKLRLSAEEVNVIDKDLLSEHKIPEQKSDAVTSSLSCKESENVKECVSSIASEKQIKEFKIMVKVPQNKGFCSTDREPGIIPKKFGICTTNSSPFDENTAKTNTNNYIPIIKRKHHLWQKDEVHSKSHSTIHSKDSNFEETSIMNKDMLFKEQISQTSKKNSKILDENEKKKILDSEYVNSRKIYLTKELILPNSTDNVAVFPHNSKCVHSKESLGLQLPNTEEKMCIDKARETINVNIVIGLGANEQLNNSKNIHKTDVESKILTPSTEEVKAIDKDLSSEHIILEQRSDAVTSSLSCEERERVKKCESMIVLEKQSKAKQVEIKIKESQNKDFYFANHKSGIIPKTFGICITNSSPCDESTAKTNTDNCIVKSIMKRKCHLWQKDDMLCNSYSTLHSKNSNSVETSIIMKKDMLSKEQQTSKKNSEILHEKKKILETENVNNGKIDVTKELILSNSADNIAPFPYIRKCALSKESSGLQLPNTEEKICSDKAKGAININIVIGLGANEQSNSSKNIHKTDVESKKLTPSVVEVKAVDKDLPSEHKISISEQKSDTVTSLLNCKEEGNVKECVSSIASEKRIKEFKIVVKVPKNKDLFSANHKPGKIPKEFGISTSNRTPRDENTTKTNTYNCMVKSIIKREHHLWQKDEVLSKSHSTIHSKNSNSEETSIIMKKYTLSKEQLSQTSKNNSEILDKNKKEKILEAENVNIGKIHVIKELILSKNTNNIAPFPHNGKCALSKGSLGLQLPNTEEKMCIDKARGGINPNIVIGLGDNEQSDSSKNIYKTDLKSQKLTQSAEEVKAGDKDLPSEHIISEQRSDAVTSSLSCEEREKVKKYVVSIVSDKQSKPKKPKRKVKMPQNKGFYSANNKSVIIPKKFGISTSNRTPCDENTTKTNTFNYIVNSNIKRETHFWQKDEVLSKSHSIVHSKHSNSEETSIIIMTKDKFSKEQISQTSKNKSKILDENEKKIIFDAENVNNKKICVGKELLLSNNTDNVAPFPYDGKHALSKESLGLQLPNTEEKMCIDKPRGGINANIVIGLRDKEQSHNSESIHKTNVESKKLTPSAEEVKAGDKDLPSEHIISEQRSDAVTSSLSCEEREKVKKYMVSIVSDKQSKPKKPKRNVKKPQNKGFYSANNKSVTIPKKFGISTSNRTPCDENTTKTNTFNYIVNSNIKKEHRLWQKDEVLSKSYSTIHSKNSNPEETSIIMKKHKLYKKQISQTSKKNSEILDEKEKILEAENVNSKKIYVAKELLSNSTDNISPFLGNRKCALSKESLELQLPNTEEKICIDKARDGINANILIGLGDKEQSHSSESIHKTNVESKKLTPSAEEVKPVEKNLPSECKISKQRNDCVTSFLSCKESKEVIKSVSTVSDKQSKPKGNVSPITVIPSKKNELPQSIAVQKTSYSEEFIKVTSKETSTATKVFIVPVEKISNKTEFSNAVGHFELPATTDESSLTTTTSASDAVFKTPILTLNENSDYDNDHKEVHYNTVILSDGRTVFLKYVCAPANESALFHLIEEASSKKVCYEHGPKVSILKRNLKSDKHFDASEVIGSETPIVSREHFNSDEGFEKDRGITSAISKEILTVSYKNSNVLKGKQEVSNKLVHHKKNVQVFYYKDKNLSHNLSCVPSSCVIECDILPPVSSFGEKPIVLGDPYTSICAEVVEIFNSNNSAGFMVGSSSTKNLSTEVSSSSKVLYLPVPKVRIEESSTPIIGIKDSHKNLSTIGINESTPLPKPFTVKKQRICNQSNMNTNFPTKNQQTQHSLRLKAISVPVPSETQSVFSLNTQFSSQGSTFPIGMAKPSPTTIIPLVGHTLANNKHSVSKSLQQNPDSKEILNQDLAYEEKNVKNKKVTFTVQFTFKNENSKKVLNKQEMGTSENITKASVLTKSDENKKQLENSSITKEEALTLLQYVSQTDEDKLKREDSRVVTHQPPLHVSISPNQSHCSSKQTKVPLFQPSEFNHSKMSFIQDKGLKNDDCGTGKVFKMLNNENMARLLHQQEVGASVNTCSILLPVESSNQYQLSDKSLAVNKKSLVFLQNVKDKILPSQIATSSPSTVISSVKLAPSSAKQPISNFVLQSSKFKFTYPKKFNDHTSLSKIHNEPIGHSTGMLMKDKNDQKIHYQEISVSDSTFNASVQEKTDTKKVVLGTASSKKKINVQQNVQHENSVTVLRNSENLKNVVKPLTQFLPKSVAAGHNSLPTFLLIPQNKSQNVINTKPKLLLIPTCSK